MNAQQQQKAIEALDRQREKERKQRYAMMYHLGAYMKLHYEGVMLPYKVLYDLEKAEHEKTFTEVPPNPYYPNPAITLKTKWSTPNYEGDYKKIPLDKDGYPDFLVDTEYKKKYEEYKQRENAEKMDIEKWGYFYARFLLPYNLLSFTDFDFWGEIPKSEEAKQVVNNLKAACVEAQTDCREHPEEYNLEPILRLEEHKAIYDVPYGYI